MNRLDLLKALYQGQMGAGDALSQIADQYSNLGNFQSYDQNQSDLESAPAEPETTQPEPPSQSTPEPTPEAPKAPKAQLTKTKFEGLNAAKGFVEGMVKRGWTPEEAAGAAGNVHVESGFKPYIKSSVPGEHSYGFLQWNKERLRGLQNYAQTAGKDWTDPETQMDYIHMERTGDSVKYGGGDERASYRKAFAGGGSASDIAERFGRFVERPKDLSQSVRLRREAALQYTGYGQSEDEFTQIVRSM